jgi:hypothetical protein
MPRRRLFLLPVVIAAVVVASASARDPLSERVHLTKADNTLASRVSLQASDLATGWKLASKSSGHSDDTCPGYQPDFSSITITGHRERSFRIPAQPLFATSIVEVFATVAQTQKEWRLSTTRAAAKCFGSMLNETDGSTRLVSSRVLPGPRFGEASIKFAFVMSVKSPSGPVPVHIDLLAVRQDRAIIGLMTASPFRSIPGQQLVLARMVSRMEKQQA